MIVLDTHAWVWWLTKPEKLGKRASKAIDRAERIGVPAISVWEVAMKAEAGKLKFDRPYALWIEEALVEDDRTDLLPLSAPISAGAVRLSWDHADPADRFIVSTALTYEAALVSADERIQRSGLVKCVWD